jgi:biotin synthase
MKKQWYETLSRTSLAGKILPQEIYETLLNSSKVEMLSLLNSAYQVRKHFHGREVTVHILNNVSNGLCSEDCNYCAQSTSSFAEIIEYQEKNDSEILAEAEQAYAAGAHRYCMVYAGRGKNIKRAEKIAKLVTSIKEKYPIEVCVSAGLMDEESTAILKRAGLDRLNHNLNTSASRYGQICTTHTFADRLNTLKAARKAGLEVCSGIIAGMGETPQELIELALLLRDLDASSIPINFLLPIKGNKLATSQNLTPQYCLKILCLFRFINPKAEIRTAAGREYHLRSLEPLSLYAANSLFMDGYLNTQGSSRQDTLQMIIDAGFTIKSDKSAKELLLDELGVADEQQSGLPTLKNENDLHPARQ